MGIEILKRAERLPNGRVIERPSGRKPVVLSPDQLTPAIVATLTPVQLMAWRNLEARMVAAQMQRIELGKQFKAFLEALGLNPKAAYRINPNGEVIRIGSHISRYL